MVVVFCCCFDLLDAVCLTLSDTPIAAVCLLVWFWFVVSFGFCCLVGSAVVLC